MYLGTLYYIILNELIYSDVRMSSYYECINVFIITVNV